MTPQHKLLLNGMLDRAMALNSLRGTDINGTPVQDSVRDFLTTLCKAPDVSTEEGKKANAEALAMMKAAWRDPNGKEARALNALRLTQTDNFIKVNSNYMRFFNVVTLGESDIPGVTNETQNEIKVGYIAEDGSPRHKKIEKIQDQALIDLAVVSTPKVGYRTRDIYKGDLRATVQKTFDMAFDMAYQIDRLGKTLMDATVANGGAFGAFTLTGNKASRMYVPHSGIVTAHLPTTNAITVNQVPISTDGVYNQGPIVGRFGVRTLQEICRYADGFAGMWPDGDLQPTGEILVPASDVFAVLLDLSLISTSQNQPSETEFNRQVNQRGYGTLHYNGITWKFIKDNTIASGACYPIFNKKIGNLYLKPSMDEEFTNYDAEKHYEWRMQSKVLGLAIINQWRMNAAKFTYK
jgi:hypothetical protein